MKKNRDLKPWKCRNQRDPHIMGFVYRDGSNIRKLLLLRNAIPIGDGQDGEIGEIDVIAIVEGYVADVRCDICNMTRTWVPGPEVIRKLIKDRRKYGV